MTRRYVINGECLVQVRGAAGSPIAEYVDLGLAESGIVVTPTFRHRELQVDDFGPDVPPEVLWMLATVVISMTLIHYDDAILRACINESMGGGTQGTLVGAGLPLGGNQPVFHADNHYVHLNLRSPVLGLPWRFPTTFLTGPAVDIPLGTNATAARLEWRAIPYNYYVSQSSTFEITSASVVLWNRNILNPF